MEYLNDSVKDPAKDPWEDVFRAWPIEELRAFLDECRSELKSRERHKKDALFDEIFRLAEKA